MFHEWYFYAFYEIKCRLSVGKCVKCSKIGARLVNWDTRRPCFSFHGSACMTWSLGSSRRSRSPDMGNGKPPYMLRVLRPALLKPQEVVSQALTLSRGARFITWRLRRPSLGECWRSPRHFWECCAFLGYSPVPVPTLKRPCVALVRLMWRTSIPAFKDSYSSINLVR